ncbi:hypothetical protein C7212DRAFT_346132 [Tuber magnatum]|uniref:Tropomyosin n=1 Tax=Tuber magnatum TaxID=42249 RepID=A0A317SJA9_9PEZI|nr:hypothetical protein C7212DRAFT_346132 [Tuber magnatum]
MAVPVQRVLSKQLCALERRTGVLETLLSTTEQVESMLREELTATEEEVAVEKERVEVAENRVAVAEKRVASATKEKEEVRLKVAAAEREMELAVQDGKGAAGVADELTGEFWSVREQNKKLQEIIGELRQKME